MTAVAQANQPVGTLLRQWRERRRMSQLDLAIQAEISARHLSFVETGRSKPCDQPEPEIDLPAAGNVAVPLQIRVGERVLSFISITAVFGTPLDVTLSEMAIESFYPADDETSQFLRHR
jgi:transcriptional regulator with XRE-family HTH domain